MPELYNIISTVQCLHFIYPVPIAVTELKQADIGLKNTSSDINSQICYQNLP